MKTHRAFEAIVDPLNLWDAWKDFRHGKRRRPDVAVFAVDAPTRVLALSRSLRSGRWRPGTYRLLYITDPKRRVIAAASVPDRVVHHAIHRCLAPWWNRRFIHHSYACLEGRGVHRALLAFQRAQARHRWLLHLDVRRFFYSIDRARLRRILFDRLPEPELRALLSRVLGSGGELYRSPEVAAWLGWEQPGQRGRGLPIGNLTSQWWGNVYLDGLDHHVCRVLGIGAYLRYMDDFVLFADSRGLLEERRRQVAGWLEQHRGLRLKDPDAPVRSAHAPTLFLGHRVTRRNIRPGPKARGRLPARLGGHADDPAKLEAVIRSYAALWRFGVGPGELSSR